MADSFLLKDSSGRARGYALCRGYEICVRISMPLQSAELCADGEAVRKVYALAAAEEEQVFPFQGGGIRCVSVVEQGRLILASDWAAVQRDIPLQAHVAERRSEADSAKQACLKPENGSRQWPQRRWPPPPCLQKARYVRGCWQEEEESGQDRGLESGSSDCGGVSGVDI